MEILTIRNFGPIRSAEIELKRYNIFIGETSSGKSTVAKLYSIFNTLDFYLIAPNDFDSFNKLLTKYNIDFVFYQNSFIKYEKNGEYWAISEGSFLTNSMYFEAILDYKEESMISFKERLLSESYFKNKIKNILPYLLHNNGLFNDNFEKITINQYKALKNNILNHIIDRNNPIYIPAERLIISIFSRSLFSLLKEDIPIPECIKEFGSLFENSKKGDLVSLDFLNIDIDLTDQGDNIIIKNDDNSVVEIIDLKQTSSGFQTIIPLITVLSYYLSDNNISRDNSLVIIEEPELNLFPNTQLDLMKYIIELLGQTQSKLIITTHSPYILSALDNFILANEVSKMDGVNYFKVNGILPYSYWVEFLETNSYFFKKDGSVENILDYENLSIGGMDLDTASNRTGRIHEELLDLKYGV